MTRVTRTLILISSLAGCIHLPASTTDTDGTSTGTTAETITTASTTAVASTTMPNMTTTTMSTTSTTTEDPTTTTTTGDPECDENLICDGEEDIAGCLHDCGTCRADGSCDGSMETPYSCNHDGVIDALDEQCDDGNMEDADACTNACGKAKCGDGVQWADGGEECDDGNGADGDGCSAGCAVEHRVVFVTSMFYQGDLGGLAGADGTCQLLAKDANLSGTFKAWLSDGAMSPSSRFGINPAFSGPFELVNGTVIAQGWKDLTDGMLLHAIDIDEMGAMKSTTVWTNTKCDGTNTGANHCNGWKDMSDITTGERGSSGQLEYKWTEFLPDACNGNSSLYCFQTQ